MVDNTQVSLQRPRLNPFAFPSDTDLRFILLIVCVLGACLWTYDSALWQNQRDFVRHINAELNCAKSNHLTDLFGRAASGNDTAVARYDAAHQAYVQCLAPLALSEVVRMLSGLVLLLSVAGVMYLAYPSWKRCNC